MFFTALFYSPYFTSLSQSFFYRLRQSRGVEENIDIVHSPLRNYIARHRLILLREVDSKKRSLEASAA